MFRFYIRNVFRSNLKNNRKTIYPFYHNSQQVTSRYIKQEYYLSAFAASLPLNAVGGTLFSSINVVPPSDSFSEILPVISKAHVSGTVNADWPAFSTVSRPAKCCWPTSTILPLLRRRNVEAKCFFKRILNYELMDIVNYLLRFHILIRECFGRRLSYYNFLLFLWSHIDWSTE